MAQAYDRFSGDPLIILGPNGSRIEWQGGQPVTDQGFENYVLISLFTEPGWSGNQFFDDAARKIGSRFLAAMREPITVLNLNNAEQAAKAALDNPAFGDVQVTITNPNNRTRKAVILITPPGGEGVEITLETENGINWIMQATNPAHLRV